MMKEGDSKLTTPLLQGVPPAEAAGSEGAAGHARSKYSLTKTSKRSVVDDFIETQSPEKWDELVGGESPSESRAAGTGSPDSSDDVPIRTGGLGGRIAGWMRQSVPGSVPDHVDVTVRICLMLVLAYALSLGSYPNAVPPSQRIVIASATSAAGMVSPTLLFVVGAVVPLVIGATVVALCASSLLLAVAASGGLGAYVAAYFFVALIFAGMRFTIAGSAAAVLILMTTLNTMSTAAVAEEYGLAFVKSLWTESGIDNPNAAFQNTLVGICWLCVCIASARLLPPPRTARTLYSGRLLPKVLRDLASVLRLTVAYHIRDDLDGVGGSDEDAEAEVYAVNRKPAGMDALIEAIVQDASLTVNGGLSNMTVFEPRLSRLLCECRPPVDSVGRLSDLTDAVNDMIYLTLTLRICSKAGYSVLEGDGLIDSYMDSADTLERCAEALATLRQTHVPGDDVEDCGPPAVFDPLRLNAQTLHIQKLANEWIDAMGPGERAQDHWFDESSRAIYKKHLLVWTMAAGGSIVFVMLGFVKKAFARTTWRRIFRPPYYDLPKFAWAVKYAAGFTALVCMQIYWPAFARLEVPTRDQHTGYRFSGWYLIAYCFATTQTAEGTMKKGVQRMLGTALGGFSAWLALTATADSSYPDGYNSIGLGAWMTITSTLGAYLYIPKGFASRFGLDTDFAWGPAYFAMTQALVVMEVFLGYGYKNDITVNRIVANLAGIGMALVMAFIPPAVFGSSQREAKFLLEDKKRAFRDCIELTLNGSDPAKLYHLYATAQATFTAEFKEANDNYKDANQMKKLGILKPDPELKKGIDNLAVLGSSILGLIKLAAWLVEESADATMRFPDGGENRRILELILEGLDIEEDCSLSGYSMQLRRGEGKTHERPNLPHSANQDADIVLAQKTFTHFCIFACNYIKHRERKFDEILWGLMGERSTTKGRRTELPEFGFA